MVIHHHTFPATTSRAWLVRAWMILVVTLLLGPGCASSTAATSGAPPKAFAAHVPPDEPWSSDSTQPVVATTPNWPKAPSGRTARSHFLELAYALYSRYLTTIDGARCEHRPTCSRYAIEAVRRHGFVIGAFLSLDRLLRAGRSSVLRSLPAFRHEEGMFLYRDPLDENDFFL